MPLSSIEPEFPELRPHDEGHLVVRVLINEHGRADQVQLLVSDPERKFDRAVIDAFSAGQYQPGIKDGVSVKSQFLVEVKFHPEGAPPGPVR
ncbi:MAG: TonB family protein [Betaproteobacteria bacterium]|nr:TonB family protein [Betaproteobacteria bacterium]